MTTHETLAWAVAAQLNAAVFSRPIAAVHSMLPRIAREELEAVIVPVFVVPSLRNKERTARAGFQQTFSIDVGILKATEAAAAAESDLLALLSELDDYLADLELTHCPDAVWMRSATLPGAEAGYFPDHLRTANQFTGVVRLTYLWTA